jgi:hypothetical protein
MLVFLVLMCLHSVVHNEAQRQLYIQGVLFVVHVVRCKFYINPLAYQFFCELGGTNRFITLKIDTLFVP